VVAAGDTHAFAPNASREEVLGYWFQPSAQTWVAEHEGRIVGTYLIRPNQPGLGGHVANGGFAVAADARRLGVGRTMGEHALREARRLGFRAMQFNFVVSTNAPAVALWKQLGFSIVGTLPGAFRHAAQGFVDAYVMFRRLDE
jgi:GNAT superfamily N-acetyltransferase